MARHILLVGPTASGKSALALEVAQQAGAEIASIDAFQIFRKMDVGTGKVPRDQRRGILHHLLDLVDPGRSFSVAAYLEEARKVIETGGRPVIWTGGSGLYVDALRKGLSPAPPVPPDILRELERLPLETLQTEIREVDPAWAQSADLQNPRRIFRALGVYRSTGRTLSSWQQERSPGLLATAPVFLLCPNDAVLRNRIETRVEAMLADGWPEEVRNLAQIPGWEDSQAAKAIGYAEVLQHVRGGLSIQSCSAQIKTQSWQYARRQKTWFRNREDLQVLGDSPKEILLQALN